MTPFSVKTGDVSVNTTSRFASRPKDELEHERFEMHLQGLNKSISNLKQDVNDRKVQIFKEIKSYS